MSNFQKRVRETLENDRATHAEIVESIKAVHGKRAAQVTENLMAMQGAYVTLIGTHVRAGSMNPSIAKALIETLVGRLADSLAFSMEGHEQAHVVEIANVLGHALNRDMQVLKALFELAVGNRKN